MTRIRSAFRNAFFFNINSANIQEFWGTKDENNQLTFNAAQSTVAIKVKHYIHFVSENKNVWQIALRIRGESSVWTYCSWNGKSIAKIYAVRATHNIQGYDDDVGRLSPCMLLSTSCCCLLRGLGGFLSPVKYKQEAYLESKQAVIFVLVLHTYSQ